MSDNLARFSRILAGGAVLALLCGPAYALDVGASVGGASAGASIGGGNGARAGASVGGTSASASIGGGSAAASIGGPAGTGASVSIGAATPGAPGTPGTPGVSNPGLAGVVAGMSDKQLARTRKRCAHILGSGVEVDADLVALCKLVQMASR